MGNAVQTSSENDADQIGEEAGEPTKPAKADLASIADSLVEGMSDVQEHAIAQHNLQTEQIGAQFAELRDRDGAPFNPTIHKTNAAGEPALSSTGALIKKPGRKAGGAAAPNGARPASTVASGKSQVVTGPSQNDLQKMQCRQAGNAAANLLMTVGIIAGGEEWQPRVDPSTGLNEKLMLESAFGEYFIAAGIVDIPPGFALTIAVGGYMLPRFTMPKTKTRLQRATGTVKKWLADRKLKKHGLKSTEMENEKSEK